MIKDNSIKSFKRQIESGDRDSDLSKIHKFIELNPRSTRLDIEARLGISTQTASARIAELLDTGVLFEEANKKFNGHSYSLLSVEKNEDKIEINRIARKKKKFKHWIKQGLYKFKDFIPESTMIELETYAVYGSDYK
ncbi:winged helix-turn-helix domain-containing protein [Galbibacter sp. BG1]